MFRRIWRTVRPRIVGTLVVAVVLVVPVAVLTWYFDIFDELHLRILISVLSGVPLVAAAMAEPGFWRSRQELLWAAAFFTLLLLFATGYKFNISALATNSAIVVAILPWCYLVWRLMGRQPILLAALATAAAVMMIYWVVAIAEENAPWDILLLPVATILLGGMFWAPLARLVWRAAKRRKHRPLAGPGMQALAMTVLSFPMILVAVVIPGMMNLDAIWSAVSLTLVGVLLITVISEPLRKFLLRSGKLSLDTARCQQDD